jgi:hypothetical protein
MKTLISSLFALLVLTSCTQAQINTAWQAANTACVTAETADPIIASLIPAWGPDVETVVAIICTIPSVISDFEGLPTAQAQLKTKLRLTTMSQVTPATSAATSATKVRQ